MKALTVERTSDHLVYPARLGCLQCVPNCAAPSGCPHGGAEGLL